MGRVWGYEAALDTGHGDGARPPAAREDRGRPLASRATCRRSGASATGSCRDPMIWAPHGRARDARVGLVARRRACGRCPPCACSSSGSRSSPCCLPLAAVLLSGWVMFHMGDDVKILAVVGRVGHGRAGRRACCSRARSPARSTACATRRARSRAATSTRGRPRPGPAEVAELAASFNEMAANLERLFDARRELVALGEPRPAHAARLHAGDARGGRGRARRARRATCPRCATRCARLALLVDDLFELARIDAGALTLELRDSRPRRRRRRACLRGVDGRGAQRAASRSTPTSTSAPRSRVRARQGRARAPQPAHERAAAHARRTARSPCGSSRDADDVRVTRGGHRRRARRGGASGGCSTASGAATRPRSQRRRRARARDRPRPRRGAGRPHLGREPPRRRCARELHPAGRVGAGTGFFARRSARSEMCAGRRGAGRASPTAPAALQGAPTSPRGASRPPLGTLADDRVTCLCRRCVACVPGCLVGRCAGMCAVPQWAGRRLVWAGYASGQSRGRRHPCSRATPPLRRSRGAFHDETRSPPAAGSTEDSACARIGRRPHSKTEDHERTTATPGRTALRVHAEDHAAGRVRRGSTRSRSGRPER